MSDVSENEVNVKDFQINYLINYLINYYYNNKSKNKNKKPITLYLDSEIFNEFSEICKNLGLTRGRSKGNIAVEGFMNFMVEKLKDSPKIVQTTLFYKPQINVKQNIKLNLAQKLELKLVKKDLTVALEALEKGKGDKSFYLGMLRDAVQRAIKTFNKYEDKGLYSLLEKADKWI